MAINLNLNRRSAPGSGLLGLDVVQNMKDSHWKHRLVGFMLASLITLITSVADAQQPSKVDEKQVRLWIEQLANLSPARKHRGDADEDRLTDKEEMDLGLVKTAYRKLTNNFQAALPHLVEHIDDKRYSFPREHPSSSYYENQSVGDACRSIIDRKLLLRNPMVSDSRDIAVWHSLPIDKQWFQRVRGMSLFEMQLDSLDWLLKQPPPERVGASEWKSELSEVRQFRNKFFSDGKPVDHEFGPPIRGK